MRRIHRSEREVDAESSYKEDEMMEWSADSNH